MTLTFDLGNLFSNAWIFVPSLIEIPPPSRPYRDIQGSYYFAEFIFPDFSRQNQ